MSGMRRRYAISVVLLAAAAFVVSFALSSRMGASTAPATAPARPGFLANAPARPDFRSISPGVPLPDFSLRDHLGRPARLADFRGKPLLIAFVYGLCEDICSPTAAKIAWALDRLGPAADKLNVVAISVQPHADTPERVIAFSRRHRLLQRWRYLIGPPSEVLPVLKRFGIAPARLGEPGEDSALEGALGTWIFLADANLRRVKAWPQNKLVAEALLRDLRLLIRGEPVGRPGGCCG